MIDHICWQCGEIGWIAVYGSSSQVFKPFMVAVPAVLAIMKWV